MKFILLLALCLTTALHAQQPDSAPTPHTFSSNDGRKLTAAIIEKTVTTVTLRRAEDGQDFTLPLDRLSSADQAFVKAWGTNPTTPNSDTVTFSNPTIFEITMTTTFVVPAGNDRIDRVRIYHALPTVTPWGLSEQKFGAANLVFPPGTAAMTHHPSTDSHHLLWTLEGQQKPGERSTFTTKMTIRSADRNLGPDADKITWSDFDKPAEDPSARVNPDTAKEVHPELAVVAAQIRSNHLPVEAVRKICQWIVDHIEYDASVTYGSGSDDIDSIVRNKRGHCGHQAGLRAVERRGWDTNAQGPGA